jgi:hypothetical protein
MRIVPEYEEQIKYTECLKYWYEKAHLSYFVINDLNLTKRVEFIQQHINGHFQWLAPEFPIPLCLPFHLEIPNSFIRFIEILDKQNIHVSYKKIDSNYLNDKFTIIFFHSKLDHLFTQKVLSNSIYINAEEYHFVGDDDNSNSNSQSQGRLCYFPTNQIQNIDDFNPIKTNLNSSCSIVTPTVHHRNDK